jgi:hypothetical protein
MFDFVFLPKIFKDGVITTGWLLNWAEFYSNDLQGLYEGGRNDPDYAESDCSLTISSQLFTEPDVTVMNYESAMMGRRNAYRHWRVMR